MRPHQLIVLPALIGGAATAWAIHQSNFFSMSDATSLLWTIALLGPFVFVGAVAWRSSQGLLLAALAVLPALLLSGSPAACIAVDYDEGCAYILALSPLYLWAVVAVAALLELGSRRRRPSEAV
jgi:hypothetical protein